MQTGDHLRGAGRGTCRMRCGRLPSVVVSNLSLKWKVGFREIVDLPISEHSM